MDKLKKVIDYLQSEHKIPLFAFEKYTNFELYRALVNIRQAKPIPQEILSLQDEVLQEISIKRGIVDSENLIYKNNISVWQGDITQLKVDAIVNAANSAMLGCFYPLHACIDNFIHTYSGIQLRLNCAEIMDKQGHQEPTGEAKITPAYNLPSSYILHTVGPIITHSVSDKDKELLQSCYKACLDLATQNNLKSIAFCCISTGVFRFPQVLAAEIAINTVKEYLKNHNNSIKVIFNVFKDDDRDIYTRLLG